MSHQSAPGPPGPSATLDRRVVVLLAVLVLLVAGCLAVAGTTSRATAVRHRGETTATPTQRELVCPSSRTDTASFIGLLPRTPAGGSVSAAGAPLTLGAGAVERIGPPGHDPLTVTARGAATRGIFGTRAQQHGGMTRCGSPRASWWFVGAGGSPGHFSTLELVNPRTGPAVVDLTVWGRDGQVEGAGLRGISVRSGGTKTLKLADVAPSEGNLAVHVEASRGLVLADVADHTVDVRDPAAAPVEEWVPDQGGPSRHRLLSGLPPPAAQQPVGTRANPALPTTLRNGASLVLANPGASAVVARVRLSGKDGAFTPKGVRPTQVPPQSVVSVPLGDLVTDRGTSVLVDADGPVVAGYLVPSSGDLLHAVSAVPWRGPAAVALPVGGTGTLLLTAAAAGGSATVTQLGPKGTRLVRTTVTVPARSTVSRRLRADAASVVVTADTGGNVAGSVLVERGSASSALPLTPVLAALRVPEVRPAG